MENKIKLPTKKYGKFSAGWLQTLKSNCELSPVVILSDTVDLHWNIFHKICKKCTKDKRTITWLSYKNKSSKHLPSDANHEKSDIFWDKSENWSTKRSVKSWSKVYLSTVSPPILPLTLSLLSPCLVRSIGRGVRCVFTYGESLDRAQNHIHAKRNKETIFLKKSRQKSIHRGNGSF